MSGVSDTDRAFLEARGLDVDRVLADLTRLRREFVFQLLDRACTVGDGIALVEEADDIEGSATTEQGRVSAFIPASGAATRMFTDGVDAPGLPFDRPWQELTDLPKGLVPFHRYPDGSTRNAFEEQCAEAIALGCRRVHFTISPEHHEVFVAAAARIDGIEVSFSFQSLGTDTPCLGPDGPVRDEEGNLCLRAGGHGALLGNLQALGGDVVVIKNIDNIVPAWHRDEVVRWRRELIGRLARLQRRAHEALRGGDELAAVALCEEVMGRTLPADRALQTLDRPWRVCGMVRNQGEPGGGPFRVAGVDEVQIVEGAQIDMRDRVQVHILAGATHFNPVDLVCGMRDHRGAPYDLDRFVDPEAVIVTRKQVGDTIAVVLERPGLWNGAMARWNTVFVELPIEVFNPVKTARDLLRPRHQPRGPEDGGTR